MKIRIIRKYLENKLFLDLQELKIRKENALQESEDEGNQEEWRIKKRKYNKEIIIRLRIKRNNDEYESRRWRMGNIISRETTIDVSNIWRYLNKLEEGRK